MLFQESLDSLDVLDDLDVGFILPLLMGYLKLYRADILAHARRPTQSSTFLVLFRYRDESVPRCSTFQLGPYYQNFLFRHYPIVTIQVVFVGREWTIVYC